MIITNKDKTKKSKQHTPKFQENVNNHMIYNLGTIFPITNQHIMINNQPTHILKYSTTYLYVSRVLDLAFATRMDN